MQSFFQGGFDASKVEPDNGFEPLPEGSYVCVIQKAEEKETKTVGGLQLVLELHVKEGKYAKRVIFHRINLKNNNPKAVTIGQGQLSALCRSAGIMTPKGAHEFCNKMVRVYLTVEDGGNSYGMQNKVKKVEPMVAAAPSVAAAPEPVGAGAVGAAPWGVAG